MNVKTFSWPFHQKVYLDGDKNNLFLVTGLLFRSGDAPRVECSWFHNGEYKSAWISCLRLTEASDG